MNDERITEHHQVTCRSCPHRWTLRHHPDDNPAPTEDKLTCPSCGGPVQIIRLARYLDQRDEPGSR